MAKATRSSVPVSALSGLFVSGSVAEVSLTLLLSLYREGYISYALNPRRGSLSSRSMKGVIDTLVYAPHTMLAKHQGVSVCIDNGVVYVINGGTTLAAIDEAEKKGLVTWAAMDKAKVVIKLVNKLASKNMVEVSTASNTSVPVSVFDKAVLKGSLLGYLSCYTDAPGFMGPGAETRHLSLSSGKTALVSFEDLFSGHVAMFAGENLGKFLLDKNQALKLYQENPEWRGILNATISDAQEAYSAWIAVAQEIENMVVRLVSEKTGQKRPVGVRFMRACSPVTTRFGTVSAVPDRAVMMVLMYVGSVLYVPSGDGFPSAKKIRGMSGHEALLLGVPHQAVVRKVAQYLVSRVICPAREVSKGWISKRLRADPQVAQELRILVRELIE